MLTDLKAILSELSCLVFIPWTFVCLFVFPPSPGVGGCVRFTGIGDRRLDGICYSYLRTEVFVQNALNIKSIKKKKKRNYMA